MLEKSAIQKPSFEGLALPLYFFGIGGQLYKCIYHPFMRFAVFEWI
jgi:hypothetical protein